MRRDFRRGLPRSTRGQPEQPETTAIGEASFTRDDDAREIFAGAPPDKNRGEGGPAPWRNRYTQSNTPFIAGTTSTRILPANSRRASYGYDQRIEAHGSLGSVAAENQRAVSIEIANKSGYTRPPLLDFFMTRYIDAYANEITAFIDAIGGKRTASPSGKDGLIALALADAALKSVKEGRAVKVSEILG